MLFPSLKENSGSMEPRNEQPVRSTSIGEREILGGQAAFSVCARGRGGNQRRKAYQLPIPHLMDELQTRSTTRYDIEAEEPEM
jgi:hypothetical protein